MPAGVVSETAIKLNRVLTLIGVAADMSLHRSCTWPAKTSMEDFGSASTNLNTEVKGRIKTNLISRVMPPASSGRWCGRLGR